MLIAGEIQPFRHALELFEYEGVTLPQLSIAIESKSTLSFDYRMGSGWGESEANALLKFLSGIAVIAPKSKVSQAWEGCEKRNKEFEDELHRISAA
jgi:hypothetical protein